MLIQTFIQCLSRFGSGGGWGDYVWKGSWDCRALSSSSEGQRKTTSVERHTWNLVTKPVLKAGSSHRMSPHETEPGAPGYCVQCWAMGFPKSRPQWDVFFFFKHLYLSPLILQQISSSSHLCQGCWNYDPNTSFSLGGLKGQDFRRGLRER